MRHSNKLMVALVLAVGLVAGCKRAADPNTVRFRYWGDTEEVKIIEALLKEFEVANPGVTVKPERKNADSSYGDVLLQEFAANTAPDVIFVSTDNVDVLSGSGKLADLNDFLAKDPDLKATDFYPSMIKRYSKDGKLLVLPRDIAPIACIYYNKDLFDKAKVAYPKDDWTWDDLREKALKLTIREADGSAKQFGFADDWNLADAWAMSGGGLMMDDYFNPTKFTFADSPAVDGILFRWKLQQVDKVSPSSSDNQALNGGAMAMFLNGNLAMFHSGLWKTPSFRKISTFKWDMAGFPRKKGSNPIYLSGGSGYTMRADAINKELCWKLVKFMAGKEGQTRIAATGLAQPALMALAASPVFLDGQDPQNKKVLLNLAMNGLAAPAWRPWIEYQRSIWGPNTDPIWVRGYTGDPLKVLKETQEKANEKFFPKK